MNLYMQIRKQNLHSLNNFIIINSLCNFEVTTVLQYLHFLCVKAQAWKIPWNSLQLALNINVRCIWNILFLKLLYSLAFAASSVNISRCYLRDVI